MERPDAPSIPLVADEPTMLDAFLDFYRAALLDRAFALSDDQLRQGHPPTTLTLGRLLGHMAMVEHHWYSHTLDGEEPGEPWVLLDWASDPDAEMALSDTMTGDDLRAMFEAACADSRRRTAGVSLDRLSARANPAGDHWSLRWIQIHMIEEYARHCGHADLIRESIDGDTAG